MLTDPTHETNAARTARLKREAARRTREWRQRRRAARVPEARAVADALAEGAQFLALSQLRSGNAEPSISVRLLVDVAVACLRRQGYDLRISRLRVVESFSPDPWHESHRYVPTLQPAAGPFDLHPPRFADQWTPGEIAMLRKFMTIGTSPNVYDAIASHSGEFPTDRAQRDA